MRKGRLRTTVGQGLLVLLAGCNQEQSAFAPTGAEAERINVLFWVMTIAGSLILVGVIVLSAVAICGRETLRARGFGFYDWGPHAARFVAAWDTREEDARALARAIAAL